MVYMLWHLDDILVISIKLRYLDASRVQRFEEVRGDTMPELQSIAVN